MPDPDRVQRTRLDLARQASAPAAPPTGSERLYIDSAGLLRKKSADGTDAAAGGAAGAAQQDIDDAIAALVAGAPSGLNTLDELAAAIGDDASFATTVAAALAGKQPLDSDLTAIAALSTTSYGRALLALADAAALRTAAGLGTAAVAASGDFQPIDADLTAIAALTTTSYGRALLGLADAAAARATLGVGSAALLAATALPGTELSYVEKTTTTSITSPSAEGSTAIAVVTADAISVDGSIPLLVEFFSPSVRPDSGGAGNTLELYLNEGSTSLGLIGFQISQAANAGNRPVYVARRITPSNGSHTYSIRAAVSGGTGAVGAGTGGAGTQMPAFIRITRV